jgi:hypothetical protein
MKSTGPIESWNVNPLEVGPIYPFAGWEPLMFTACVAFCLFFIVWKFLMENAKYASKVRRIREADELNKAVTNNHSSEKNNELPEERIL